MEVGDDDDDDVAGWTPAGDTVPDGELDVCCATSVVVAEEVLADTDGNDTP